MSTVTWLAKSCFSVFWLPLDDHELTSPHGTMKNMAFDKNKEKTLNSMNKSRPSSIPIGKKKFDHSNWSLSTDEDYIVFCFGKDVAQGDNNNNKGVVNEMHKTNSRPVNRKLKYGEDEEQVREMDIDEKRSNDHQTLQEEKRVMVHTTSSQPHRGCHVEGIEESSNSDQSEGSRSSFAFPVLGWEWIGSPVQMPKSERKNKARAMRFQCCRF